MRIHTVSWSIVSGICDRKLVIIFRNDGARGMRAGGEGRVREFRFCRRAPDHGPCRNQPADQKEPIIDFKDDRKTALWVITRTEKRAGGKAPAPKTIAATENKPHG